MIFTRSISRIIFWCLSHGRKRTVWHATASAVVALAFSLPQLATATTVRMVTNLGTIDVQLYDDQAPITVANFLRYAGRGDYDGVMIHRSQLGFVIQGGGYKCCDAHNQFYAIPADPPIQNEFDPSRSNVRGTVAMAKLGGDPNSATNQWFINLANNSANLDTQNGGFTVFGNVIDTVSDPGMSVADAIAALQILAFSAPFDQLPVLSSYNSANGIQAADLVVVNNIPNVKSAVTMASNLDIFTADPDMTFGTVGAVTSSTALAWMATFTPPPDKIVQFTDGMLTFTVTGTISPAGRVVTLINGGATSPNHYYAYGPTPVNNTPHWYDFTYDGTTGAEFVGGKILLHFVDGQRGDYDLAVNNSITHVGAPAVVSDIATGSPSSVGCSIAASSSQMRDNGDWVIISMFLVFVALVRRRTRRG